MKIHEGHAVWKGGLKDGSGELETGSGVVETGFDFRSRFEDGETTTPEELIGAAHAGCFSMALTQMLSDEGHEPRSIDTRAEVRLGEKDGVPTIEGVLLVTKGIVPGIEEEVFRRHAEAASKNCVVSRALGGTEIELDATLTR